MNDVRKKSRKPVQAAGGIVTLATPEPLFAVVQMRKFDAWVLPKGKLNRRETPLQAARREVLEETGYEVSVHEFVGTLAYEVARRPKIVQFWRMQALSDDPAHELMNDIKSMRWLPLDEAVAILTHLREREFLRSVGPFVVAAVRAERDRASVPPRPVETSGEPAEAGAVITEASGGVIAPGCAPPTGSHTGRGRWIVEAVRSLMRRVRPARAPS